MSTTFLSFMAAQSCSIPIEMIAATRISGRNLRLLGRVQETETALVAHQRRLRAWFKTLLADVDDDGQSTRLSAIVGHMMEHMTVDRPDTRLGGDKLDVIALTRCDRHRILG